MTTEQYWDFISLNYKDISKLCAKRIHNQDWEDMMHDTLVKICETIDKFDETKGDIMTYINTCMFQGRRDLAKAGRNTKIVEEENMELHLDTREPDQYTEILDKCLVEQYVNHTCLSDVERMCVKARYVNMSYKEIALFQDITEANARVIYNRAITKLQEVYKQEAYND